MPSYSAMKFGYTIIGDIGLLFLYIILFYCQSKRTATAILLYIYALCLVLNCDCVLDLYIMRMDGTPLITAMF